MSDPQHIPTPLVGRTVRQPVLGPFHDICSGADVSFPKPGELIEIHGHANLTMQDRRTLNLLIVNAWPQITEDIEHRIHKAQLTGTHESTDRLTETMARLRTVSVTLRGRRNGKSGTWRIMPGTDLPRRRPGRFPALSLLADGSGNHQGKRPLGATPGSGHVRLVLEICAGLVRDAVQARWSDIRVRRPSTLKISGHFSACRRIGSAGSPDLRRYCLQPAVDEVNALSSVYCRFDRSRKAGP